MIRIALADDLATTRLAVSPLLELAASLFVLHRDDPPEELRPWCHRARTALAGADLGPLDPATPFRHSCPDFMAPTPVEPLATIEQEIARVRATSAEVMARDIAGCWPDGPPAPWDRFAADPRGSADRLADALHVFWRAVLADDWPRLSAILEGEILGRARALALAGPAAVLDDLHPQVRWRTPVLELHKGPGHACDVDLTGPSLILVPLVFEDAVLVGGGHDGEPVVVGYQARGAASAWGPVATGPDERLELLLGHGRAAVLRALERPATTTELSGRLHYAPSTVSAHLDVLARAGLVERHRVRRRVFYQLNETGASLLALLAEQPAALRA